MFHPKKPSDVFVFASNFLEASNSQGLTLKVKNLDSG